MSIYQSKIYRKGHDQPILVPKVAAQKIAALYEDKNAAADYPINIADRYVFRKGEIKSIEILPDIEKVVTEIDRTEFYQQEKNERNRILSQSPEQRAKNTSVFSELYRISTGEYPTEEVLGQVRWTQQRFFTVNKNSITCDLQLLRSSVPMVVGKKIDIYQKAMFNIIERAVLRDMQLAK